MSETNKKDFEDFVPGIIFVYKTRNLSRITKFVFPIKVIKLILKKKIPL